MLLLEYQVSIFSFAEQHRISVVCNFDNCVILVPTQYRFLHHDVKYPDFSNFRRESTKDPTVPSSETVDKRRAFTYFSTAGISIRFIHVVRVNA